MCMRSQHLTQEWFLNIGQYEAGLVAKVRLKDGAVPKVLVHVEESEAQAVSNILLVSCLCLFCVSNRIKGAVSSAEWAQQEVCKVETKGEKEATQTVLRECRK